MIWYTLLIAGVALERVAELIVSKRNWAWSRARGGTEFGKGHYPFMVALHTGLLVACLLEPILLHRPFIPALGWSMVAVVIATQGLRWWCITTLGPQWNTRVIVVPGAPRVTGGPYRWIPHPNYVVVVTEGIALPLVHTGWLTAIVFTVLNAILLRTRLKVENAALASLSGGQARSDPRRNQAGGQERSDPGRTRR